MDKLEIGNNNNLSKLIKFLKYYHFSNTFNSTNNQKYHQTYRIYKTDIISKINHKFYRVNVENSSNKLNIDILKIPEHFPMIENFISLPTFEQKNIIYLAWFILYCQKYNFNDENDFHHKILKCYYNLIKDIKLLFIHE